MDEQEYREYRDLIASNRKIEAIKLYRERYGGGLREAKDAIDAMAAGRAAPPRRRLSDTLLSPHSLAEDPEIVRQIEELIRTGKMIEAIKLYRSLTGGGLKESKDAIDAMAAGRAVPSPRRLSETLISPHSLAEDPETVRQIEELIRTGKMIEAIKLYRSLTGGGLKESKDAIDAWAVRIGIRYPDTNGLAMRILKAWAVRLIARYRRPSR